MDDHGQLCDRQAAGVARHCSKSATAELMRVAWRTVGSILERVVAELKDVATGQPLSCPDPHVIDARRGGFRYYMVCTTDREADALVIHKSNDLVHWLPAGYVFPHGRQPWWALPSATPHGGRFWAPEIYRIGGKWVVYFSTTLDASKVHLGVFRGTQAVGVASSPTLRGPWSTRILHYRGEFNRVNHWKETFGGVIDPSVARDERTGQLYLFWAVQPTQIWVGKLSLDGLRLDRHIRPVLVPSKPWECHPAHRCTIEGPEPFYRNGVFDLFYSGAGTWDGSYAVGQAVSPDPFQRAFKKLDSPILHSGNRFLGPGHCSQPVTGPDGRTYILYHATPPRTPTTSRAGGCL